MTHSLSSLAKNPVGSPLVWNYLFENYISLSERYGFNDFWEKIVPSITANFATEAKRDEVKKFFNNYSMTRSKVLHSRGCYQIALYAINNNIKWVKENGDKLDKLLK